MELQIDEALLSQTLKNLKNPEIVLHTKDLEKWLEKFKPMGVNFDVKDNLTYKNIPIRASDFVLEGSFYIQEKITYELSI